MRLQSRRCRAGSDLCVSQKGSYGKNMTRFLITVALLLSHSLPCLADEALRVPTQGQWQGQLIGTWTATRITHRSPEKPVDQGIYKTLLLGEDENHNTMTLWGKADDKFQYISKTPTTAGGTWSEGNPMPIPDQTRDDVLKIDGQEYPVFVKVFAPKPDKRSGMMKASTLWELKSRPGFVLMHNQSQKDSFRGETFEYLITEKVTGVGQQTLQGKSVRVFRIQHDETMDGRTTSHMEILKSDDLPKQGLIHSFRTRCDENGKEESSAEVELLAFGCAPEDVAQYLANTRSRRSPREYVSLDSEAGKVNVAHLMRQGMPESSAQKIVSTGIRKEDLEYGKKRAAEIDARWKTLQTNSSQEGRNGLLQKLQGGIGSNTIGYIEPTLETVLVEITHSDDPALRIAALTCLAGYVPVLYASLLEDTLIQEKQCTNVPALRVLSSSSWGNLRRVLSQDGVDMTSLPLWSIPYAPDDMAIKELMNRFDAGGNFQRFEVLEHLGCYMTPEVRTLFTRLANDLTADDFIRGKTDHSYLVPQVITAAANLNIENAPDLFLKWMDWNDATDSTDSSKPQDRMMKFAVDMTLMISSVRLRAPQVNSHISRRIVPGSMFLSLFLTDEGRKTLGPIELDITPKAMEALLSKPVPMTLSGKPRKDEQLYDLLRLFCFSPDDEDLTYFMSKLAPEWTAQTDYAAIAEVQSKRWYTQRKGIKPLRVYEMRPNIMADMLPSFGDKGTQILIQLSGHPGLRAYMVQALMKITHRRDEAREYLSKVYAKSEDDRFLIGLTLWCLGDTERQAEYEKYIRFKPVHSSGGRAARRAMRYLPFETVYALLQDIRKGNPDNGFGLWASSALSNLKNRQSAEFIMLLWDEDVTSRNNPEYGELFNRMAGQNFGMDRNRMRQWIQTLPAAKIDTQAN